MSTPRKPDAQARVARARAEVERSLAVLRPRRQAWGRRLHAMPWWALLLGGFVGGALAGRTLGRARPPRAAPAIVAALGPLWRLVLVVVARIYAASSPVPAAPGGPDTAAPAAPTDEGSGARG